MLRTGLGAKMGSLVVVYRHFIHYLLLQALINYGLLKEFLRILHSVTDRPRGSSPVYSGY